MAKIKVLGSSSAGNGYIIDCNNAILLIECGVSCQAILQTLGARIKNVQGCLVSHIHNDHARNAKKISELYGITIASNKETIDALKLKSTAKKIILTADNWQQIGDFAVYSFACKHDVPNFGFIIKHEAFGTILFATDTYAFPFIFKGINNYMIEANYSDNLLKLSKTPYEVKQRILVSHMSLDYTIKYLQDSNAFETARTITLIHLSANHSNAARFQQKVQQATGIKTYIADTNTEIDISK